MGKQILNVYMMNSEITTEAVIGNYRILPVKDIREVTNPVDGFPILVIINPKRIPSNLTGLTNWWNDLDTKETRLYSLSGGDNAYDYDNILGEVALQVEDLNRVHPKYYQEPKATETTEPTEYVAVDDTFSKGVYMTNDEISQAIKNIEETFAYVSINKAQDVFLLEGDHPTVRVFGELMKVRELDIWTIDEFNVFLAIMSGIDIHKENVSGDLYYDRLQENLGRLDVHADIGENNLRCHLYRSFPKYLGKDGNRDFNAVINIRVIPKRMPVLEDLNLPEIHRIFEQEHGLLLVSGKGNDGKSTTVAGIVNQFNNMEDKYRIILTIEEPVEFVHVNRNAWIIQKRVGEHGDSSSYELATEDAMREDTDIVVIQELRKQDEMQNALRLAEIGKLVIATIHANSVSGTISRFVNEFSDNEKEQVRSRLLDNLLGIIHQNLIMYDGKQYPLVSMLLVVDNETREELRQCKDSTDIEKLMEESESTDLLTRSDGFDTLIYKGLVPEKLKDTYIR